MTQEEKARAYDEALARAKDMMSYKEVRREDMEYLFPELKKSEDEKIRKELLAVVNDLVLPDEQQSRFIAWLEKQGEQNHNGKKWIYEDAYLKEREQLFQDGINEVLENPQKYGFEKSADKVKPFKVGDWVMNKSGGAFSNGSISARVQRIEGHKVWFEHGTYAEEWALKKNNGLNIASGYYRKWV